MKKLLITIVLLLTNYLPAVAAVGGPVLADPVARLKLGPAKFDCRYMGSILLGGPPPTLKFDLVLGNVQGSWLYELKAENIKMNYGGKGGAFSLDFGPKDVMGQLMVRKNYPQLINFSHIYDGPVAGKPPSFGWVKRFDVMWDSVSSVLLTKYKEIYISERAVFGCATKGLPCENRERTVTDYTFICDLLP
jgi:hypothetical protein